MQIYQSHTKKIIDSVIVTDCNYLTAASVTASELTLLEMEDYEIKVSVAIVRGSALSSPDSHIIEKMISFGVKVFFVEIYENLQFRQAHFNETILYKILVPSLFETKIPLLISDAGLIPGSKFHDWLRLTIEHLAHVDSEWVFAAHCNSDPPRALGSHLAQFAPNARLYPAATLMFCNTENYRTSNTFLRLIQNYNIHRASLFYAEQELLCITLKNHELCDLDGVDDRWTPFIRIDHINNTEACIWTRPRETYIYYKVVGPIKPWSPEARALFRSLLPYYQAEQRMEIRG